MVLLYYIVPYISIDILYKCTLYILFILYIVPDILMCYNTHRKGCLNGLFRSIKKCNYEIHEEKPR
nr:MAG TPA: hypothetical protein [Caudoviricetes sp.]